METIGKSSVIKPNVSNSAGNFSSSGYTIKSSDVINNTAVSSSTKSNFTSSSSSMYGDVESKADVINIDFSKMGVGEEQFTASFISMFDDIKEQVEQTGAAVVENVQTQASNAKTAAEEKAAAAKKEAEEKAAAAKKEAEEKEAAAKKEAEEKAKEAASNSNSNVNTASYSNPSGVGVANTCSASAASTIGVVTTDNKTYSVGNNISQAEYEKMIAVVCVESGNQTAAGKLAVASTVLNAHENSGSSIDSTLNSNYIKWEKPSGAYTNYLTRTSSNAAIYDSAKAAVDASLAGTRNVGQSVIFFNGNGKNNYFSDNVCYGANGYLL